MKYLKLFFVLEEAKPLDIFEKKHHMIIATFANSFDLKKCLKVCKTKRVQKELTIMQSFA